MVMQTIFDASMAHRACMQQPPRWADDDALDEVSSPLRPVAWNDGQNTGATSVQVDNVNKVYAPPVVRRVQQSYTAPPQPQQQPQMQAVCRNYVSGPCGLADKTDTVNLTYNISHQQMQPPQQQMQQGRKPVGCHAAVINGTTMVIGTPAPPAYVRDHPCRDFLRGVCRRGSCCRFSHAGREVDESTAEGELCRDHLRGVCTRDHCRFIHAATANIATAAVMMPTYQGQGQQPPQQQQPQQEQLQPPQEMFQQVPQQDTPPSSGPATPQVTPVTVYRAPSMVAAVKPAYFAYAQGGVQSTAPPQDVNVSVMMPTEVYGAPIRAPQLPPPPLPQQQPPSPSTSTAYSNLSWYSQNSPTAEATKVQSSPVNNSHTGYSHSPYGTPACSVHGSSNNLLLGVGPVSLSLPMDTPTEEQIYNFGKSFTSVPSSESDQSSTDPIPDSFFTTM